MRNCVNTVVFFPCFILSLLSSASVECICAGLLQIYQELIDLIPIRFEAGQETNPTFGIGPNAIVKSI